MDGLLPKSIFVLGWGRLRIRPGTSAVMRANFDPLPVGALTVIRQPVCFSVSSAKVAGPGCVARIAPSGSWLMTPHIDNADSRLM